MKQEEDNNIVKCTTEEIMQNYKTTLNIVVFNYAPRCIQLALKTSISSRHYSPHNHFWLRD